jgi:methyl-accepting chemotaxis protein
MVTSPAKLPLSHFDDLWFQFGPALIASFILLPLVIYDIISLSNRFTGPLFRLRRSMRALANGEEVKPIRFRDGDFWQGLAEEFNAVLERMQSIKESSENVAGRSSKSVSSDEASSEDDSLEVTAKA